GYKVRDRIEESVVSIVHQLTRSSDFLGKIGERMIMILPHTDAEGVKILMERVRARVKEFAFEVDGRPVQVTISAGIAAYPAPTTLFFDPIIKNAENAPAQILSRGGNAVGIHSASPETPEPNRSRT